MNNDPSKTKRSFTARSGSVEARQIRQTQRSDCTDRSQGEKKRLTVCRRTACSGATTAQGGAGETIQGTDLSTRSNPYGAEDGAKGVLSFRWQLHPRGWAFAPQQQARSRGQAVPELAAPSAVTEKRPPHGL